jgi:hypothetical protein
MNVRLRTILGWNSGLVHGDQFCVNQYQAQIDMITVTADNHEQNIAYERVKHITHHIFEDAIMIAHDHPKLTQYQHTGARVIVLPDEPVDQIMGMMLYLKFNAVMENRMVVTDVEISSVQGDNMGYLHSHGENLSAGLSLDGWWVDAAPTWYDVPVTHTRDKVVSLNSRPEWADHGLAWTDATNKQSNSVVFADFGRDADK